MAFGFLKKALGAMTSAPNAAKPKSEQEFKPKKPLGMGKAIGLGVAGGVAGVLGARKFGPKYNPTPKPEPVKDGKSVFSRVEDKYKKPATEKKPFGSFERKPTSKTNAFQLKK